MYELIQNSVANFSKSVARYTHRTKYYWVSLTEIN